MFVHGMKNSEKKKKKIPKNSRESRKFFFSCST